MGADNIDAGIRSAISELTWGNVIDIFSGARIFRIAVFIGNGEK